MKRAAIGSTGNSDNSDREKKRRRRKGEKRGAEEEEEGGGEQKLNLVQSCKLKSYKKTKTKFTCQEGVDFTACEYLGKIWVR